MNKYYLYCVLCFSLLQITSCDLFSGESEVLEQKPKVEKIVELPDSVKEKIIKQDSLAQNLIAKIDTLTNELNSAKDDLAEQKQRVEDIKSPNGIWNFISLAALILGVIALLMSRNKGLRRSEVEDIFKDCLTQSKTFHDVEERVGQLESSKGMNRANRQIGSNLESRVQVLESNVREIADYINKTILSQKKSSKSEQTSNDTKRPEFVKNGYAKINSEKYFVEIIESLQEGCVYKITFKSANRGEFDLISLDKIKSSNGWQDVIEYVGDCLMDEAVTYRLEQPGVIEKMDDGKTWEVTRKLKIIISK